MKRGVIALILAVLILNSFLVIAQQDAQNNEDEKTILPENAKEELEKATSKTNQALEKEIEIPSYIQIPIKIIFGIERTISISLLIIVLAIWLFSLLLFANILKLTPFFKNWTAWPAAIGITILIALSGVIKNIALFLLNTGDLLSFLAKWSAGVLLLIVTIILLIAFISLKMLKKLREKLEIEQAKEEGTQIGATLGFAQKMREMFGFTRKI